MVFMFHGKLALSVVLYRKKKDTQGFGEESREPSTGKHVFLASALSQSDSGAPVLINLHFSLFFLLLRCGIVGPCLALDA